MQVSIVIWEQTEIKDWHSVLPLLVPVAASGKNGCKATEVSPVTALSACLQLVSERVKLGKALKENNLQMISL